MVEIDYRSPLLVNAMLIWTGWGSKDSPTRDDTRVIDSFGEEAATSLLPVIKSLENDFYESNARFVAADVPEMAAIASQQFLGKYPGISEEIVEALAWCYTFDFK